MPSQQLDNLVRIGQLKAEPAVQAEIDGLMRSGAARIKDAENTQLSLESRFDLAPAHARSRAGEVACARSGAQEAKSRRV
jgi:hypothetical protein